MGTQRWFKGGIMKFAANCIIGLLIGLILGYLFFAYMLLEPNPFTWEIKTRVFHIGCSLFGGFIGLIKFIVDNEDPDKISKMA